MLHLSRCMVDKDTFPPLWKEKKNIQINLIYFSFFNFFFIFCSVFILFIRLSWNAISFIILFYFFWSCFGVDSTAQSIFKRNSFKANIRMKNKNFLQLMDLGEKKRKKTLIYWTLSNLNSSKSPLNFLHYHRREIAWKEIYIHKLICTFYRNA